MLAPVLTGACAALIRFSGHIPSFPRIPLLPPSTLAGNKAAAPTREFYTNTIVNVTEVRRARRRVERLQKHWRTPSPLAALAALIRPCHLSRPLLPPPRRPQFADLGGGVANWTVEMSLWDASQRALNAFRSVGGG